MKGIIQLKIIHPYYQPWDFIKIQTSKDANYLVLSDGGNLIIWTTLPPSLSPFPSSPRPYHSILEILPRLALSSWGQTTFLLYSMDYRGQEKFGTTSDQDQNLKSNSQLNICRVPSIPKQDMGLPMPNTLFVMALVFLGLFIPSAHPISIDMASISRLGIRQAKSTCPRGRHSALGLSGMDTRAWDFFLLKNNYYLIWEIISLNTLNWNKFYFWCAFRKAVHILSLKYIYYTFASTHHFSFYHDTWDKLQTVWQEGKKREQSWNSICTLSIKTFLISVSEMNPQL